MTSSQDNYYTSVQAKTCVRQAQIVTCLFQRPIHITRLDERTSDVFILAGENIGITVFQDGNWRFEPDE